jgi:hypothetical protein
MVVGAIRANRVVLATFVFVTILIGSACVVDDALSTSTTDTTAEVASRPIDP